MIVDSIKDISVGYDTFWESRINEADNWVNFPRSLRMKAMNFIPPIGRILDCGCGNGIAMSILSKSNIEIVGLDISRKALKSSRLFGEVIQGDATLLPFDAACFDSILLLDAFEHCVNKSRLINEISRVLKPEGLVVATIPFSNEENPSGDERQPYDQPLSSKDTINLLSKTFRIEKAFGRGFLPTSFRIIEPYIPDSILLKFQRHLLISNEALFILTKFIK